MTPHARALELAEAICMEAAEDTGSTHYEGCERDHPKCRAVMVATALIERLSPPSAASGEVAAILDWLHLVCKNYGGDGKCNCCAACKTADWVTAKQSRIEELEDEVENLKAYARHERSLGAEGPMIELNDCRQELTDARARVTELTDMFWEADKLAKENRERAEAAEQRADQAARDLHVTLAEHWLTGIHCDHEAKTDMATCFCTVWTSGPMRNVGEAVQAWIDHVEAALASRPPDVRETMSPRYPLERPTIMEVSREKMSQLIAADPDDEECEAGVLHPEAPALRGTE